LVKKSTMAIQNQLAQLGEDLGFRAVMEYSFESIIGTYSPRYDVVWFLNVEALKVNSLSNVKLINEHYLPFAAFEVEGSTTSSKNQLGNIGNLQLSPCYYNFMVVNNAGATTEIDTYRRGMKIVRSMQRVMGERQLFFLDSSTIEKMPIFEKTTIGHLSDGQIHGTRLKGSGGEKKSIGVAKKMLVDLSKTKLHIDYDRSPDYFKWVYHIDQKYQQVRVTSKTKYLMKQRYTKSPFPHVQGDVKSVRDYYYVPKIDIACGFDVQGGFVQFLHFLANQIGEDAVHFPLLIYVADKMEESLYFPLLGIEIEMKESKHALGSLMNLSNFHYVGWLVSPKVMEPYVSTYKRHLGMQNVHYIDLEDYL